jgi:hypothetical protein
VFAAAQPVEDRAPDRLGQHLEHRQHALRMPWKAYAMQRI